MAEFEMLQGLWQQQPQPSVAQYGRRQDWINIAKIAAVAIVIGWEAAQARRSAWSLAMVAGIGGALVAADWRSQRAISRLSYFICSGIPFAGYEVIRRLRIKRFEGECRPLVDRLVRMLEALEERDE